MASDEQATWRVRDSNEGLSLNRYGLVLTNHIPFFGYPDLAAQACSPISGASDDVVVFHGPSDRTFRTGLIDAHHRESSFVRLSIDECNAAIALFVSERGGLKGTHSHLYEVYFNFALNPNRGVRMLRINRVERRQLGCR